ncbi:tight adherence protein C [Pararobbsia alpina]|uniref:type II secretion system F family protein n=1 Tax=Pararobbsia alpina TaxID=621374 RepID=UPI0039A672B1
MSPDNFNALVNLLMLLALLAGIAIWWATQYGGLQGRIAERAREAARFAGTDTTSAGDNEEKTARERWLGRLARFGEHLPMFDNAYRERLKAVLRRGGYRSPAAVPILLAIKFLFGLVCAALAVTFGTRVPLFGHTALLRGALMLGTFILGMIVPEWFMAWRSRSRRKFMASCLPDALDLLVICTNAGNSLGVSIRRVSQELALICPPLSDEFLLTADELQLSGDNERALNGLAERIDLPSIRSLIATLTQSMRYGTPITHSLKTLSRTERLAHIVSLEERAAKLAPKMVIPMMIFVLPGVLAIAAGPAIIQLLEVISKQ